jgi:hypothetical protein
MTGTRTIETEIAVVSGGRCGRLTRRLSSLSGTRRARDRCNRVAPEAGLERAHDRLTDTRQRGLRPRDQET